MYKNILEIKEDWNHALFNYTIVKYYDKKFDKELFYNASILIFENLEKLKERRNHKFNRNSDNNVIVSIEKMLNWKYRVLLNLWNSIIVKTKTKTYKSEVFYIYWKINYINCSKIDIW